MMKSAISAPSREYRWPTGKGLGNMAIVLMVGSLSAALHLAVQSSILPLRLPQLSFNYACAADQLRSDERILSAPTFASNARSTSLGGVVDRQRVGGQQAVSAAVIRPVRW